MKKTDIISDLDEHIKTQLLIRGFDYSKMLNNRGLIGAVKEIVILSLAEEMYKNKFKFKVDGDTLKTIIEKQCL